MLCAPSTEHSFTKWKTPTTDIIIFIIIIVISFIIFINNIVVSKLLLLLLLFMMCFRKSGLLKRYKTLLKLYKLVR